MAHYRCIVCPNTLNSSTTFATESFQSSQFHISEAETILFPHITGRSTGDAGSLITTESHECACHQGAANFCYLPWTLGDGQRGILKWASRSVLEKSAIFAEGNTH